MATKRPRALSSIGNLGCIEGESEDGLEGEGGASLLGIFLFRSLETKGNLAALLVKDLLWRLMRISRIWGMCVHARVTE